MMTSYRISGSHDIAKIDGCNPNDVLEPSLYTGVLGIVVGAGSAQAAWFAMGLLRRASIYGRLRSTRAPPTRSVQVWHAHADAAV